MNYKPRDKILLELRINSGASNCPVDRIIQEKGLGLKQAEIISWTQIIDIEVYKQIIEKINVVAKTEGKSIAQWELEVFERR